MTQLDKTPPSYTPDLQALNDKNTMKSAVRKLVMNNWRKVSNITINNISKYEEWNIVMSKQNIFRQCIADLMLEFYGCQKREFWHEKEVKARYWISNSSFEFVQMYWWVAKATSDHSKQYTWDGSWMDIQPEAIQVNEMQNKVESNSPKIVENHNNDIKKRIWELTIELLDAKTDIDKEKLNIAIDNLKKILSPNKK